MMRCRALLIAAVVLGGTSVSLAEAAPKTDTVVVKNGDRITCEVERLRQGLLEVSTDDLGTVQIEWDKVVAVTSTRIFEIETVQGVRYLQALVPGGPGQLAINGPLGTVSIDLISIVRLVPIEDRFLQRLEGSLSAGGSYVQSSGVGQLSASAQFSARRPRYDWQVQMESTTTIQNASDTSGRYTGQFTYTRQLDNRWVLPAFGRIESNRDQGYDLRSTGGGAVGRNLVQTNRTQFQLAGGLAVNREAPVDGDSVTNVDALGTLFFSFFTYDYPKTTVTLHVNVFPSLSDLGRLRTNVSSTLARAFLTNDFFTSVSLFDDYDNRPPTAGADTNDVGVTFSIGWKF